jgi:hypothetical protein
MQLSAWIQHLGSVSAAIATLAACAGPTVDRASTLPDRAILVRPGRAGLVVAARADGGGGAAAIAREIAEHTGFGLVVAPRGAPLAASDAAYARAVSEAARGSVRFLVEVGEGDRPSCAGRIEIVTAGVDAELAVRLRALAELIRDAHLRANPEIPRLAVLVDAGGRGDGVSTTPSSAGGEGTDALRPERTLRIELPPCSRRDWRETYGAVLADFVAEAATLPAGR